MNRSVIVDDNDVPSIVYSGPWLATDLGLESPTPSYSNTIHMITTTGRFDYSFTGSEIIVVGYMLNTTQESWNCAIDGNTIPNAATGSLSSIPLPSPNVVLCSWDLHTDSGPHTLTVNVNNTDQNFPFHFNYIEYLPTQSAAFDNATVFVNPADNEIKYGGQWSQLSFGMGTSGPNSNFTFTFEGISLALLGHHLSVTPNATTGDATYSVDNNSPVSFDLTLSTPGILFETLQLPFGTHTLTVMYQTDNSTTFALFVLDALIVQNATTLPDQTAMLPGAITTAIPNASASASSLGNSTKDKISAGPIAGGVVGAFLIGVLISYLIYSYLHRRRTKLSNTREGEDYIPPLVLGLGPAQGAVNDPGRQSRSLMRSTTTGFRDQLSPAEAMISDVSLQTPNNVEANRPGEDEEIVEGEMSTSDMREQLRLIREQIAHMQDQQPTGAQGLSDNPPPRYTLVWTSSR